MNAFSKKREKINSPSFWMAGIVLIGLAASMIPCMIVALVYHEDLMPFFMPFLIYSVLGGLFLLLFDMGLDRKSVV